jgi:protein-disulfide isomerase
MKRFFTFTALAILIVASAVFGVMEFKKEMTGVRQDLTDIKNEIAALKPLLEKPAKPVAPAPRPVTGKTGITGDPFLGSPDSPLVLVEFSDYQCPFCARFFRNTLPLIKKDYIDTGKLRYGLPQAGPEGLRGITLRWRGRQVLGDA